MRTAKTPNRRFGFLAALVASATLAFVAAAPASADPAWRIDSLSNPTAPCFDDPATASSDCVDNPATPFVKENEINYLVEIHNSGDKPTAGEYKVTATFPAGLTPVGASSFSLSCEEPISPPTVTCSGNGGVPTGQEESGPFLVFTTALAPGSVGQTLTSSFEVSGGEAGSDTVLDSTRITAEPPAFGIADFDGQLSADPSGSPFSQAAGHPYALSTAVEFNSENNEKQLAEWFGEPGKGDLWPVEPTKDVVVDLPPGMIGNPNGVGQCTTSELARSSGTEAVPLCTPSSQVGTTLVRLNIGPGNINAQGPIPVYNMVPPTGSPARFGFNVGGTVVVLDAKLRSDSDYGVSLVLRNVSEGLDVQSSSFDFWGVPGDSSHTHERACPEKGYPEPGKTCESNSSKPFLRLPTSCTKAKEGLKWTITADGYYNPGRFGENGFPDLSDPNWKQNSYVSHESPGYPDAPGNWGDPQGPENCDDVPVDGSLNARPTSIDTETSSGLDVRVEIPNPGLENAKGIASSDIKKVEVKLPQGITINPSQAEGLGVCSPARYESTKLSFYATPDTGCPDDSKIGVVSVKTPLLEETLPGSVYVAKPFDNPFKSLLALYIVIEEPERGILVKLPGELRTNEQTGQIEATFDNVPQVPFSTFDFHFREGARAPLVTPPTCGTYTTTTEITGHSDPDGPPLVSKSSFEIVHGIGGGPCPPGGVPGFKPQFSAGSINNNAGAYSPFNMRITRSDGEQDMTRFSAVLPPGVLGKLVGVAKCPQSAVAIAKSKEGLQEIASPSCPANSEIGRSLVGAGVGSVLTYIPGKVYLGGPVNGRPLSVIAITPAVAGPFDVGTVAVQEALTLNPKTAEVEVDGAASDPIPHILKGIPAKLRDLRVYVDRDKFTLNPTSCDPSSAKATLFGGAGNAFTSSDDVPVFLSDRYQAANCAALGFKPKLGLKLKGGTKRGGHPALQATYRPRGGDANVEGLVVRLPRSAFLDQAHIRTICTRVQFAAKACPKGAQYGYIKAWTPLLEEPLQGPVWLRSSNHKLPDLVFDLHGLVDIEVATRIDSVRGGIRASVNSIPDAPLTKVVLRMQGAKKGLIVNSRNLCRGTNKANVESDGQNGKVWDFNPVMRPDCGGKKRKQRRPRVG